MFEDIFYRRKPVPNKLTRFGFQAKEDSQVYDTAILDGAFTLHISVLKNGNVDTDLVDNETNEPYILYKANGVGPFVGEIRGEIEKVLRKIAEECYDFSVFKTEQATQALDYARNTYGDEPEFLWDKFPDYAVLRRKDSNKWYGIIMTIPKNKLGLPSKEMVEIIDLRLPPEEMEGTIDRKRYFPGWHMNKKSWYTMILDKSVSTEEICGRIDASYRLAEN